DLDEVLERAPQPIRRPDSENVELAPHGGLQHGVKGWALVPPLGTADTEILVDLDDCVPGVLGPLPKRGLLVLGALPLIVRAHARVDGNPLSPLAHCINLPSNSVAIIIL